MLTEERHRLILDALKDKGVVKINDLVDLLNTSESTIRRDLTYLESINALKRVHGGATLLKGRFDEPSYNEKLVQSTEEKTAIAKYAASLIKEGDCIYLDAGTTTFEMISFMDKKDIIVVTNGLKHIDALVEKNINCYILGGEVKAKTKAIIGVNALSHMGKFRFDKAFIGINGIHYKYGFTTPDIEEAALKENAIELSRDAYILADESKFGEVAFVKVSDIEKATIITNSEIDGYELYKEKTRIEVVMTK